MQVRDMFARAARTESEVDRQILRKLAWQNKRLWLHRLAELKITSLVKQGRTLHKTKQMYNVS